MVIPKTLDYNVHEKPKTQIQWQMGQTQPTQQPDFIMSSSWYHLVFLLYFTKYTSKKYLPPIIGKLRDRATTLIFTTLSNSVANMEQVAMQVATWHYFRMDHTMWACLSILAITLDRKIRMGWFLILWKADSHGYNFHSFHLAKIIQ